MTALEKVREMERRVKAVIAGQSDILHCCFCDSSTAVGSIMLCCEECAEITAAICHHEEFQTTKEACERIGERVMRAGLN